MPPQSTVIVVIAVAVVLFLILHFGFKKSAPEEVQKPEIAPAPPLPAAPSLPKAQEFFDSDGPVNVDALNRHCFDKRRQSVFANSFYSGSDLR
ncbi:MAG: hypothetical protein LBJ64_03255 [Deltaproteobacteria bacterium]|jgi:hypothetical protein|nr:hypothetical protein [Deltaproteobacteria bacterium]